MAERGRAQDRHGPLAATGIVQLVGGAVLLVLPLPFLPFEPSQDVAHYASHALLGLAQLPLLAVTMSERFKAQA